VRSGREQVTTARGVEAGVLIQAGGETWRRLRNGPMMQIGGWVLLLVVLALYLFYRKFGQMKLREPRSGHMIERFTAFERLVHWTVAISFSVLALSGLVMLFGKYILLPVFGYTLFGWLASLCKALHNFVGPLFIFSIVAMVVTFIRDNFPKLYDLTWIARGGGLISGVDVPCGRFNAGEKAWFWIGALGLGVTMGVTGLILDFPNFDQGRSVMQLTELVHGTAAMVFIAMSFGHIYLGTAGMEGAYEGMRYGAVDETWAKEHHLYWYNDVKSGKTSAARAAPPAAGTAPPS
jgi:formate dehydrogenase subunit gamma